MTATPFKALVWLLNIPNNPFAKFCSKLLGFWFCWGFCGTGGLGTGLWIFVLIIFEGCSGLDFGGTGDDCSTNCWGLIYYFF